ncbi:hypothetical protein JW998_12365, partial [candidate division KSB1 bacterium]|nr:hypothetical protein [candidate division KSB1 bacterium]
WTIVKGHCTPNDGGYIVASYTNSFGDGDYDLWLLKTDANGDTLWTKFYGGPEDELGFFMDVQVTADGGYILAGCTYSYGQGTPAENNAYLVKTDANGDILWTKTYGGLEQDEAFAVQQTADNGYIISCYSYSYGAGGSDIYLIKTDENGDIRWTKTIGGSSNEAGRILLQTAAGEYIAGGSTHSYGAGQVDAYLVKLGKEPTFIDVPADQPTIQAGINAASDGDIVLVDDGTYYENINFKGKAITVASRYLADGDTSHMANTIIDGSQPSHPDSGSVVFFISGEDTTSVLYGFTITNGTGTIGTGMWRGEEHTGRGGGGVACDSAGASILYNKITHNTVIDLAGFVACGGGINAFHFDSTGAFDIIIKGNQITNNKVIGNNAQGAGVRLRCNAKVLENDISYNSCEAQAGYANGIGILCLSDPSAAEPYHVTFANNTISHNSGISNTNFASGGGIFIFLTHADILNNEISYNELTALNATSAEGAGITLWSPSEETVVDANTITHNEIKESYGKGGGLYMDAAANPLATNNIISFNAANKENYSDGGGVHCADASYATFINNTIVNNDAFCGGGIYCDFNSHPIILNSIVWDNQADSDAGIYGDAVTVAYSDIQGGWDGENNLDVDPCFEDDTFYLSDYSPCIGTGIASIPINGVTYTCPSMDCDCKKRPNPSGSAPDMGAFESRRYFPLDTHVKQFESDVVPLFYSLAQNSPNPFNPSTTIAYDLPTAGYVRLIIYDLLGRQIRTLVDSHKPTGRFRVTWDGRDENGLSVAGGLYFCRMQAGEYSAVVKMVLVR